MKGETRLHQGRLSEREEASTLIGSVVFSDGLKDSPIVELIGMQSLEESRQKPQEGMSVEPVSRQRDLFWGPSCPRASATDMLSGLRVVWGVCVW